MLEVGIFTVCAAGVSVFSLRQDVFTLHSLAPLVITDSLVGVDVESSDNSDDLRFRSVITVQSAERKNIVELKSAVSAGIDCVKSARVSPVKSSFQVSFQKFNALVILNFLLE